MGKKIHILLSKESWEELEALKKKLGFVDCQWEVESRKDDPKSYEEYLEKEKLNPTMAWCA